MMRTCRCAFGAPLCKSVYVKLHYGGLQMEKTDRMDWIVCGRKIGTASGWDQSDTFCCTLFEFIPADGVALPEGDISIHFESGAVETYGEDGEPTISIDLIGAIGHLPITPL